MRLQNIGSIDECVELKRFLEWIASIGDTTIGGPNDGFATIDILDDLLLKVSDDPIATIVESIYPLFGNIVDDPTNLQERIIWTPTLDVVESINEYMISLNVFEEKTHLSSDSLCKSDTNIDLLHNVHTHQNS